MSRKKLTYEYVKEQIESVEGYKLKSEIYKNSSTKLKIQCKQRHDYKASWNSFQQGYKCPYCANNIKYTYNYIKEQIEIEGFKLKSKMYVNNCTKLEIKCDKDHDYEVTWNNWQKGRKCPICDAGKTSSKAEKEILEIVKSITNENVISNDRTQITNSLTNYNLELDIWIPSLNKAIEFNGVYWHSLEEVKVRDVERLKQCKEKGIDLLVIQEQDWKDNKNKCIKQIKNWIN